MQALSIFRIDSFSHRNLTHLVNSIKQNQHRSTFSKFSPVSQNLFFEWILYDLFLPFLKSFTVIWHSLLIPRNKTYIILYLWKTLPTVSLSTVTKTKLVWNLKLVKHISNNGSTLFYTQSNLCYGMDQKLHGEPKTFTTFYLNVSCLSIKLYHMAHFLFVCWTISINYEQQLWHVMFMWNSENSYNVHLKKFFTFNYFMYNMFTNINVLE